VITELLKRHSKAKRRAPVYSRALSVSPLLAIIVGRELHVDEQNLLK